MSLTAFVASSKERQTDAQEVADALRQCGITPLCWWEDDAFRTADFTLLRLRRLTQDVDTAVIVCTQDDKAWYRGDATEVPRDNCILEVGLFLSKLGPSRTALFVEEDVRLPTDLRGLVFKSFTKANRGARAQELAEDLRRGNEAELTPIVPVVSSPDIQNIANGAMQIPAGWYSRALYLGDRGAANWLAVAGEPAYILARQGNRAGAIGLWRDALRDLRPIPNTVVSLGPGDGSADSALVSIVLHHNRQCRWIPVDITPPCASTEPNSLLAP